MKKVFFILFLSARLLSSAEPEPLIVGTTSGYAPYVSLDAQGKYEGFDIDFAAELAQKLGRKVVIKDCGCMPSLLLALQQKKIDVLIWAVSITEDRLKRMEMIYYQGEKVTEMPFLFWKNVPEGISSIEDFSSMISVEAGSFQETVLRKYPNVQFKQVDKITDAIMEIRFGKSQAAMADPSLIGQLTARYPELKVLYLPLRSRDYSLGNGVCVSKTNLELSGQIRRATEELIAEGRVAALEKKWNLGG